MKFIILCKDIFIFVWSDCSSFHDSRRWLDISRLVKIPKHCFMSTAPSNIQELCLQLWSAWVSRICRGDRKIPRNLSNSVKALSDPKDSSPKAMSCQCRVFCTHGGVPRADYAGYDRGKPLMHAVIFLYLFNTFIDDETYEFKQMGARARVSWNLGRELVIQCAAALRPASL